MENNDIKNNVMKNKINFPKNKIMKQCYEKRYKKSNVMNKNYKINKKYHKVHPVQLRILLHKYGCRS